MNNVKQRCGLQKGVVEENRIFPKSLLADSLWIKQPEKGYRYSIDAVILAWHANASGSKRVVDLGTGCGIIALILARRFPHVYIAGVEIQKSLVYQAQRNVLKNQMAKQVKIICEDLRNFSAKNIGETADMVVTNPPFGKAGCTRLGPDKSKCGATHEIFATLSDVVECSARLLNESGTLMMIYPAQRLVELFCTLRKAGLEPKRLRTVHPHVFADANRVIVKAVKHGRQQLVIESPLYVHQADGAYTPEVEAMFKF